MGAGPGGVSGPGGPRARARARAPGSGTYSRAARGRAGSRCWSPAGAAGSPSASRCPAAMAARGCAGGCGTSPPGTGPAGAGSGRSGGHRRGWGRAARAGGSTSPCARTPAAFRPHVRPARSVCLLCTRPGDAAVARTLPPPSMRPVEGAQSTNTLKKRRTCHHSKGRSLLGALRYP